ncbi:MerR family transcriptional regulator [Liquorilactobacillus hordei]|uniref:MerR family transcriptional regulator n=1 Tax=Liquorilactobacillus hordei TaxID=468911 RepID=A0A3S6QPW4_9LACO|nr:MerR family transcriptional regulator [Liquorilactobacillus hordei]AUJ29719.1 MerR family transcriptional regulator [Liquorilactobacillus hordei]MBZ2405022.1 MerR family transcriptional regulator [Liquorilactobacillus hordei]
MNVKEASEITGVSTAAIRYYEKEKLLPEIDRDINGNREIDERIIKRITFILKMRAAGMSVDNLRKYMQLVDAPGDNAQKQIALLKEQLIQMEEKRDNIQAAVELLHYKLDHYYDHVNLAEKELKRLDQQHDISKKIRNN